MVLAHENRLVEFDRLWSKLGRIILGENSYMSRYAEIIPVKDETIRVKSFNSYYTTYYLKRYGKGKITSCDMLVDVPYRNNHSYGGFCNFKKDGYLTTAMVCNDTIVGHFNLKLIDRREYSIYNLAEFTYQNCFGG